MTVYKTLTVIGIGLIGASILRRAGDDQNLVETRIAYDIDANVVARAEELGLADVYATDLKSAVLDADCVVICTPVSAIAETAARVLNFMKPGATLTDVGSVRRSVFDAVGPLLRDDISYIPAHPMAGTEFSGPDAGFATLFENRWCLFTPTPGAFERDITRLENFWKRMGARIRRMEVEEHDRICAMVSHLPHLIAFTICDTADKLSDTYRTAVLDYAASGFRDFTRIAGSDPVMWRDIFLSNKDSLLEILGLFQDDIAELADAIRRDDDSRIIEAIVRGRRIRKSLIENEPETPG